jgi:ribosome recycling factor
MEQAFHYLSQEFSGLQMGRAHPGIVENISFEAYTDMYQKVKDVASVLTMDAQTLKIEPWDKSVMNKMEKAIYDAGLGLAPQNQGDYLMIKIPALTQERRKELVKFCEKLGEQQKVAIRNIRQDAMKDIKKLFDAKEFSEDQKKHLESEVESLTKNRVEKISHTIDNKSDDIMKV